jgi:hypothetical protein
MRINRSQMVILTIGVVVISAPCAVKYAHLAGVLVMGLVVAITVASLPWLRKHLESAPRWVLPAAFAVLVVALWAAFGVGYTLSHSGAFGSGSDRADALNVALSRLESGQFPYAAPTYLGNPISPLPGALLLAAPFHALGDSAWENLVWIPGFAFLLSRSWKLRVQPTLIWAATTVLSLEVMRQYVVGDDLFVSGVYVAVAVMCVLRSAGSARASWFVAASAFLGVAVCSRPHFLLLVPIVAAYVWLTESARRAALCAIVAATVAAMLAVPFALTDWAQFSPLHVAAKVTSSSTVTSGLIVLAAIAAAILVLALILIRPNTTIRLYSYCAIVLAAPAPLSVAQTARSGREFNPFDLTLAAPCLVFIALAIVASLEYPIASAKPGILETGSTDAEFVKESEPGSTDVVGRDGGL